MAVLSVWLLLLAGVGASSGVDRCPASGAVKVLVAPGGPVLLRLEESELAWCGGECQLLVTNNVMDPVHKGPIPPIRTECRYLSPGCHVHPDGSLELTGGPDASARYTLRLMSGRVCQYGKQFRVHIQEPVSEPEVQLSCFAPGEIGLCCRLENGTKVSYSWSVNGTYYNSRASCRNFTIPQTELVKSTCTALNLVSERTSQPLIVTCPDVPVADGDAIFVLRLVSAAVILVAMAVLIRWHLM